MLEDSSRDTVSAERMHESAVLTAWIDEEIEPCLVDEPKALDLLCIEYPPQRPVNATDAMDGVHDNAIKPGKLHTGLRRV